MSTVYIMCGLPGSGKTTKAHEMIKLYPNALLYSFDAIYNTQWPCERQKTRNEVHKEIVQKIKLGYDIIYDDLNITKKDRWMLLSMLPKHCKKICIFLNTPLQECLKCNKNRFAKVSEKVIHHLSISFQPPSLEEGWNDIIYINR